MSDDGVPGEVAYCYAWEPGRCLAPGSDPVAAARALSAQLTGASHRRAIMAGQIELFAERGRATGGYVRSERVALRAALDAGCKLTIHVAPNEDDENDVTLTLEVRR